MIINTKYRVEPMCGSLAIRCLCYILFTILFGCDIVNAQNTFAGADLNSATNLSDNRARFYDPQTGAFLSKDPMGVSAGLNSYIYCNNNPTNATDVSGMDSGSQLFYDSWYYWAGNAQDPGNQGAAKIPTWSEDQAKTEVALINSYSNPNAYALILFSALGGEALEGPLGASGIGTAGSETLFRTMSTEDFQYLLSTGKVASTGETFTSPSLSYASEYSGTTVKFTLQPGTIGQLADIGVRDSSKIVTGAFPSMPSVTTVDGWTDTNAYFKGEGAQINIGLGTGAALDTFNNNILSYGIAGSSSLDVTSSGLGGLLGSTSVLSVGGVLINQAATLVGSSLADIKGATYDPTTKQIVFLGTNQNGASLSTPLNMDYFYTAIKAVYGSATPPYVTLDPPASPASQWPLGQSFVNNSTQGFVMVYNPLWPGEDTTIAVRFRMTDQTGTKLYDFTYNFNAIEWNHASYGNETNVTISGGGRYLMGLTFNPANTSGNVPPGLTLNTAAFATGQPGSYNLSAAGQTAYYPIQLTNNTGGPLTVNSVIVIPARQHREYGGRVDGTKLGWAMYEADRVMKCLAVGKDNLTGASYNSTSGNVGVTGYKNLEELAQSLGDTGGYNRLWFEPNDMTLQRYVDPVSGQATIGFQSSTIQLLTEAYLQGVPADPAASAFATFFTNNYSAFATQSYPVEDPINPSTIDNVPIFAILQQAMQAVCLARFFHDNNIPLDQWWMSSYQPPVANTPLSIATAFNEAPTGSPWYLIYGGVKIHKPNNYVPSANAQTLGANVLSARPSSTSSSARDVPGQVWNASDPTQGNLTAVSGSLAHDYQDGNVNLAESDLSFASPGELPLKFTRYYQSSWLGTTNLGPGWRDVRYTLQFSAPSWYDQSHLMFDSSGHAIATAASGDTYLHSGTVRLVDLSTGNYLDFTSSLNLTYGLNAQGNSIDTITGLNGSDLPSFSPGTHQSGATLVQKSDGTFNYTATLPDGSILLLDPNGNLLQTTDRHGHKQIFAYNSSGQLYTVTDDAGQVLTLSYDPTSGLLSSVVGPTAPGGANNEGVSYAYTGGLLTNVVNTLSNVQIAQYAYNSQNQLATVTRMDGTIPINTTADVKGRSSTRQNTIGNSTSYTYVKNLDGS